MALTSEPSPRTKVRGRKRKAGSFGRRGGKKRAKEEEKENRRKSASSSPGDSRESAESDGSSVSRRKGNPHKLESPKVGLRTTPSYESLLEAITNNPDEPLFLVRNVDGKRRLLSKRAKAHRKVRNNINGLLNKLNKKALQESEMKVVFKCVINKIYGWTEGQDFSNNLALVRSFFVIIDNDDEITVIDNGMAQIPNVGVRPGIWDTVKSAEKKIVMGKKEYLNMKMGYLTTIVTREVAKEEGSRRRAARACTSTSSTEKTEVEYISRYGARLIYDSTHEVDLCRSGLQQIVVVDKDECVELTNDLIDGDTAWMNNNQTLLVLDRSSRRTDNSHLSRLIVTLEDPNEPEQEKMNESIGTKEEEPEALEEIEDKTEDPMTVSINLNFRENEQGEKEARLSCTCDAFGRYRCDLIDRSFCNLTVMKSRLESRFPCFRFTIFKTELDGIICLIMKSPEFYAENEVIIENSAYYRPSYSRTFLRKSRRIQAVSRTRVQEEDMEGIEQHEEFGEQMEQEMSEDDEGTPRTYSSFTICGSSSVLATRYVPRAACLNKILDRPAKDFEVVKPPRADVDNPRKKPTQRSEYYVIGNAYFNTTIQNYRGDFQELDELVDATKEIQIRKLPQTEWLIDTFAQKLAAAGEERKKRAAKYTRKDKMNEEEEPIPREPVKDVRKVPCFMELFFPHGKIQIFNILLRYYYAEIGNRPPVYDPEWVTRLLIGFIRKEYKFIIKNEMDGIFSKMIQLMAFESRELSPQLLAVQMEFLRLRRELQGPIQPKNKTPGFNHVPISDSTPDSSDTESVISVTAL